VTAEIPPHEPAPALAPGVLAFTTTRDAGTFGLAGEDPVSELMGRWGALRMALPGVTRVASAPQVHGARVVRHAGDWEGWLRTEAADGHFTEAPGLALAVSVADCTPVFMAHPRGAVSILHAGWRGTASRIVDAALRVFANRGYSLAELRVHLGPAICGRCYEVGPEVHQALTGETVAGNAPVDVRAVLRRQLETAGVRDISVSPHCTRCHNDRFFSHRAGDSGRQLGLIAMPLS
jgi:polyphenol oxidase